MLCLSFTLPAFVHSFSFRYIIHIYTLSMDPYNIGTLPMDGYDMVKITTKFGESKS